MINDERSTGVDITLPATYNTLMMRDMAEQNRPRERLLQVGERAVSTAELLAIVLRSGVPGEKRAAPGRTAANHL